MITKCEWCGKETDPGIEKQRIITIDINMDNPNLGADNNGHARLEYNVCNDCLNLMSNMIEVFAFKGKDR